jgi:hypothetical protein
MIGSVAAFFDLDRTLLSVNSGLEWARYELRQGNISRGQLARAGLWTVLYQLSLADLARVYATATRHQRGGPRIDLDCSFFYTDSFSDPHRTHPPHNANATTMKPRTVVLGLLLTMLPACNGEGSALGVARSKAPCRAPSLDRAWRSARRASGVDPTSRSRLALPHQGSRRWQEAADHAPVAGTRTPAPPGVATPGQ